MIRRQEQRPRHLEAAQSHPQAALHPDRCQRASPDSRRKGECLLHSLEESILINLDTSLL